MKKKKSENGIKISSICKLQHNPKLNPIQLHARIVWDELLKKLGHSRPEIEREVTAFFSMKYDRSLRKKSDSKNDIFIRYDYSHEYDVKKELLEQATDAKIS